MQVTGKIRRSTAQISTSHPHVPHYRQSTRREKNTKERREKCSPELPLSIMFYSCARLVTSGLQNQSIALSTSTLPWAPFSRQGSVGGGEHNGENAQDAAQYSKCPLEADVHDESWTHEIQTLWQHWLKKYLKTSMMLKTHWLQTFPEGHCYVLPHTPCSVGSELVSMHSREVPLTLDVQYQSGLWGGKKHARQVKICGCTTTINTHNLRWKCCCIGCPEVTPKYSMGSWCRWALIVLFYTNSWRATCSITPTILCQQCYRTV